MSIPENIKESWDSFGRQLFGHEQFDSKANR